MSFLNPIEQNPHFSVPAGARIVERVPEAPDIVTLRMAFDDPGLHAGYRFMPGQFNMVGIPGLGEIALSIVSDPSDEHRFDHTLRRVGRVSEAIAAQPEGGRLGVRGPFGRGWPMDEARGGDVLVITGGLGCAPVMSAIQYVLRRREAFRRLVIIQGVKNPNDLIWRETYQRWRALDDTQVLLAADQGGADWPWHVGLVTTLIAQAEFDPETVTVMCCGPERMMHATAEDVLERGVARERIWLSLERNMQCGLGRCGHCQLGPWFICRDGPVFPYTEVRDWLGREGV